MGTGRPFDVCVLYARSTASNLPRAIEAALKPVTVWWDKKIGNGDYRSAIFDAIGSCACVVPIWTNGARSSAVLADELKYAKEKGIAILPVRVKKGCEPLGFGSYQAVNALGWDGAPDREELAELRLRVLDTIRKARGNWGHPEFVEKSGTRKPAFFFSVSSHETKVKPSDALEALKVFGADQVLVSAYDFEDGDSRILKSRIRACQSKGAVVVLDSGNYERYRRDDAKWTYSKFKRVLSVTPHDLAFTYDEVEPPKGTKKNANATVKAFERDSRLTIKPLIPIIHLPKEVGGKLRDAAAELAVNVAAATRPVAIAIPERELGEGLFARIRTMREIRHALNGLPFYQPVHVLGTGTPISMALLVAAGADSFDGLEWCRYVVDSSQRTLHHFQLYELFAWQDVIPGVNEITRAAVADTNVRYTGKVVFHNLDFYSSWLSKLRSAASSDESMSSFLRGILHDNGLVLAKQALPEMFDDDPEQ